ncbi:hypothetical protein QAD02_003153 [Eretmocerus hayati]|uniref:Uncharacterized protein n=1 Tax=Eretmocerus hayati TaxID=131215 RepID=A0ACC2NLC2_9HYME|nr:hypothetical protein QAD02_003153 [Eretmocerus hayati]
MLRASGARRGGIWTEAGGSRGIPSSLPAISRPEKGKESGVGMMLPEMFWSRTGVADGVDGGLTIESAEEVTSCMICGADAVDIGIAQSGSSGEVAGAGGSARSSSS